MSQEDSFLALQQLSESDEEDDPPPRRRRPMKQKAKTQMKDEMVMAISQNSIQNRQAGFSMEDAMRHNQAEREKTMAMSPREVLGELQKGNTRFWMGLSNRPETSAFERRALIMNQFPKVAVLGCADSRVPIELVFDQGLGDLFVVRVAGNCLDTAASASLEFAVHHLKVKVLIVIGHEGCGAIKASQLPHDQLMNETPNLRRHLLAIKGSLDENRLQHVLDPRARDREAVVTGVNRTIDELQKDEGIMKVVKAGELVLVGAFYEISSGIVDFLKEING